MTTLDPDYTPEFEDVIKMAIEQRLFDLNVSLPGIVQTFDANKQTASVQPSIMRSYAGVPVNLPVILDVPVVFPAAAQWQISGPVNAGDTGHLIFSQRSLDIWKTQGGIVDPQNPRKFHITDATFYPGLRPASAVKPNTTQALRLQNGNAQLDLTPDGKVEFTMIGGAKLLDTLIQITTQLQTLAKTLSTTTTNTMLGPQPLLDASNFASDAQAIEQLLAKLQGLEET